MPLEAQLVTGLAMALAVAWAATPVAIRVADRLEFYDRPVGYKGHGRPTPYLGGAAVMGAFAIVALVLTSDLGRTLPLVGGAVVLWAVGTVDDRRHVTPLVRVAVEMLLASALWGFGMGWKLGLGAPVDWAVSVLWVVAVVNAFNLFDNMDGATGSMAAVVSGAVAVLGAIEGDVWLTVTAAALCGACMGFLPYNLTSPARIFLGDGGSMPVGFAVAALVMAGASGAAAEWQSLAMGLLLVGVPALDTALVLVSRRRRGVSFLTGGRDHLTHRARTRLETARIVALTLGGLQALVAAVAIVAVRGGSAGLVVAVLLYLLATGVAIAVLDTRIAPAPGGTAETPAGLARGAGRPLTMVAPLAILLPLALAMGLSPFDHGFYDSSVWAPVGLGLVAVAAAVAMARPPGLPKRAWVAMGCLAGLALWALASSLWADSAGQAVVEGNRLLLYAMLLGTLLVLIRTDTTALWLLGALTAVCTGVAGVELGRMLGPQAGQLFVGGRLDAPLGYINGQASYFLLGFWLCLAIAEQRRSAVLAGLGLAAATAMAALAVLSQSRGVAVAALASTIVVLAVVPGRLRRAWALVAVGASVSAAGPFLFDVYETGHVGVPPADTVNLAAAATLLAAIAAGVAWGLAVALRGQPAARQWLRPAAAIALAALVTGGSALAISRQADIRATIEQQYTAFVKLGIEPQGSDVQGTATTSRLVSGAGTRYDYWRIAWQAFRDRPVAGVGAGGYDTPYFARRATVEDVRQPHSVQLQTLSELGLIGGVLLLGLFVAVGVGARRAAEATRSGQASAGTLAVAGVGVSAAWVTHTSVDWIHLLPGVTGIAVVAAALLLRRQTQEPPPPERGTARGIAVRRLFPAVAAGLVLAVAAVSLSRQALSEHYRDQGQAALAQDPATALTQADRSLRLDAETVASYHLKAAALARFGRADDAEATLLEAARREPKDFVTWALLGDLSVRRGRLEDAATYYGRASALNPRDPGLSTLASDPAAAAAQDSP